MTEDKYRKQRDYYLRRTKAGEKKLTVWVPDDPEAIRKLKDLAAKLRRTSRQYKGKKK